VFNISKAALVGIITLLVTSTAHAEQFGTYMWINNADAFQICPNNADSDFCVTLSAPTNDDACASAKWPDSGWLPIYDAFIDAFQPTADNSVFYSVEDCGADHVLVCADFDFDGGYEICGKASEF
jgi:hypothetical protein